MPSKTADEQDATELVEILRQLEQHRLQLWQKTYGKMERAAEQEEVLTEFYLAFSNGHGRLAAKRLRRFIQLGGNEVMEDQFDEIERKVCESVKAHRAAEKSGKEGPNTSFGDVNSLAEKAYREFSEVREYHLSKEEHESYWNHPLACLCRQLEERIGVDRHDLERAAQRLNTVIGLRPDKPTAGPDGKADKESPDWLWMGVKFSELDEKGTTQRLLKSLVSEFPTVCEEAGLLQERRSPAAKGAGKRGRRPSTDPKEDKRISEAWQSGRYETYKDLAAELNMPKLAVERAVDRHRKRLAKRRKTPR